MAKRTFKIYRYDPDTDSKPYMQTVEFVALFRALQALFFGR